MKIRTRLTLDYIGITAFVMLFLMVLLYFSSKKSREQEFSLGLKQEAITKANLFLKNKVDASTMQSIYRNNRAFLDEVEVAIYTPDFVLLYHDAMEIDIIKETPEMLQSIVDKKEINFYVGRYQGVGLLYAYEGKEYILTAAAYDGYGYAKMDRMSAVMILLGVSGMLLLFIAGRWLARAALSPVAHIVDEVEQITASNLDKRIEGIRENDEIGELAVTFNRMLDRLEKSFEAQKMFVSHVSHELRTPLAALIGEMEITLFRERSVEDYRQTIENILSDSRKLAKLSAGMLDLAKASYDVQQISMKEVRVDELLLDARELAAKGNEGYVIHLLFEQEPEDDSGLTVRGNEYLLRTAFVNLIENNCKFSDNHTSHVRISFF